MVFSIDKYNRGEVQRQYVDSIISRMDFMEIRDCLRDHINEDLDNLSNGDLYDEIRVKRPELVHNLLGQQYLETSVL
jgi:hypothetical protein